MMQNRAAGHATLRQMLALLEGERQALAALDLERILKCAQGKLDICAELESWTEADLDEESRSLLDAVRRLNDINRRLRNLVATNIQSRLSALSGSTGVYRTRPTMAPVAVA